MLKKIITLLFLSGEPMKIELLSKLLDSSPDKIATHLDDIRASLESIGLALLESNEGLSIVTQPDEAALVQAFWKEELQGELTPASLQVLTLVAYLGTPTREEISYIRGVQSSQSIRTLTVRGLIARSGETCTLTGEALMHLGVTKAEDLPDYPTLHASLVEKLEARTA